MTKNSSERKIYVSSLGAESFVFGKETQQNILNNCSNMADPRASTYEYYIVEEHL
jgi:hypothetical protein